MPFFLPLGLFLLTAMTWTKKQNRLGINVRGIFLVKMYSL